MYKSTIFGGGMMGEKGRSKNRGAISWIYTVAAITLLFSTSNVSANYSKGRSLIEIIAERSFSFGGESEDSFYSHQARLNIYFTQGHTMDDQKLERELELAQKVLDDCQIQLKIKKVYHLNVPSWMSEWESFAFNDSELTEWEKKFFSWTPKGSAGLLFVDSLDWTIGDDGVTAIGYAGFVMDEEILKGSDEEIEFYSERIQGHSILGRAINKWTITHEIGHSIMNLKHSDAADNIMFNMGKKAASPTFSQEQCQLAKQHSPYISEIN